MLWLLVKAHIYTEYMRFVVHETTAVQSPEQESQPQPIHKLLPPIIWIAEQATAFVIIR